MYQSSGISAHEEIRILPGLGFHREDIPVPVRGRNGAAGTLSEELGSASDQQPHITAFMCHPQPGRTAAESSAITEQAAVTSATSACISSAVDIERSGSSSARCFVLTAEL